MRHFVLLGSVAGKWISSKGEFQANDLSESCHSRKDILCDGSKCGEWDCASLEHNGKCEPICDAGYKPTGYRRCHCYATIGPFHLYNGCKWRNRGGCEKEELNFDFSRFQGDFLGWSGNVVDLIKHLMYTRQKYNRVTRILQSGPNFWIRSRRTRRKRR